MTRRVKKQHSLAFKIFAGVFNLIIFPAIIVISLPLFYLCLLTLLFVLPPLLYGMTLHEHWQEKTLGLKQSLKDFFSLFVQLPLVLLMILAILRSIITLLFSFFPPALMEFRRFHDEFFFLHFTPVYGELFPYWVDVFWGLGLRFLFEKRGQT